MKKKQSMNSQMLKLSEVQHSFTWTYFQPQFYLRVYVRVNHTTVFHKRFRRCPRAPGSAELREGEHENKTGTKSSLPTFTCLLLSSSPLSQILALSPYLRGRFMTFSFPALVLTHGPLPALVLFDFQKEKESHVGVQAMSSIQKIRFRARIKHFTENIEFLE